jgi:F-type H+-transporting ATPase subunit gamma
MANLKEVRNRIVSVNSTMQITSAMKMVSAAKLKRAQDAIVQMRPYAEKLREILENLSAGLDTSENVFARESEVKNVLIIAVGSNRGLAGAFNSNVIKRTNITIAEHSAKSTVKVLCIGKKSNDAFKRSPHYLEHAAIPNNRVDIIDKIAFANVAEIAEHVMTAFAAHEFDKVVIVYNQFKNAAVQNVVAEQMLPVVATASSNAASKSDYIFEPSKAYIVSDLIPRSLKTQLYKSVLDSNASEHGARMTAMHKATDNAKEMVRELKIGYNKARQASITKEILEIVGGAAALEG